MDEIIRSQRGAFPVKGIGRGLTWRGRRDAGPVSLSLQSKRPGVRGGTPGRLAVTGLLVER